MPDENMTSWEEWQKDDAIMKDFNAILHENHISANKYNYLAFKACF